MKKNEKIYLVMEISRDRSESLISPGFMKRTDAEKFLKAYAFNQTGEKLTKDEGFYLTARKYYRIHWIRVM